MNNKSLGFTLIELMIVVAIIGILASIAYPSYTDSVTRSNRSEAQRELVRLANLQEQYFVDHREYTNNISDLGVGVAATFSTDSGLYKITATVEGTTFELEALALGVQAANDAGCLKLFITDTGKKSAGTATTAATDCWEQ